MYSLFINAFLTQINTLVNRVLQLDPTYDSRVKHLNGKSIAVIVKQPQIKLYISVNDDTLLIEQNSDSEPNAIITGNVSDFISTALSQESNTLKGALRYEGQIQTGQAFQDFFKHITIDWEEQLSKVTGDVVARQTMLILQGANQWFGSALENAKLNCSEYITEESRLSPSPIEQENFYDDVDDLRDDVERLSARVERLQCSMPSSQNSSSRHSNH